MKSVRRVKDGLSIALRLLLSVALVCMLGCGMFGCKNSDVLTEHIEDPVNGVLDPNRDPSYIVAEGAPPDPTKTSNEVSDSDRQDDQVANSPDYDENQQQDQETDQREQEETPHEQNATDGNEDADREGDNQTAGDGENKTQQSTGSGNADTSGSSDQTQKQSGKGAQDSSVTPTGGRGGDVDIFDNSGSVISLPEDVGTVVACGNYATIVQMLCGKGGLSGCDPEWKAKVAAGGYFPDEGVEDLPTPVTEVSTGAYEVDVDAIINDTSANVVLIDNKSLSASEDEQAALKAAGINVVIVPTLGNANTPDTYITQAVQIVGELMKASSYVTIDAAKAAETYVTNFHNAAVQSCLSANGGYSYYTTSGTSKNAIYQTTTPECAQGAGASSSTLYTAYIDEWYTGFVGTYPAAYCRTGDGSTDNNYPWKSSQDSSSLMLNINGVGLSLVVGSGSGYALMDFYMQTGGAVDMSFEVMAPSDKPFSVAAGISNFVPQDVLSPRASASQVSALWFNTGSTRWALLGDSNVPGVIVKNDEIAASVLASASDVYGYYNMGQSYGVYVMPEGFDGSWVYGSVESYLLAPWTWYMFHQSDANREAYESYVNDFYTTFYRVGDGACASLINNFETSYTAACPTE